MEQARRDGVASEKTMWQSIDQVDGLLVEIESAHPDIARRFMKRQHELLYGPHYNEAMAVEAVKEIRYTDREGKQREGAYWSLEEVESATRGMSFPSGVTKWDKYVAFNVFYSDVCKRLDDDQVLYSAYLFFFADEDFEGEGKVWKYMECVR